MAKVGRSDFSRTSIKALAYANTLQGLALDSIREQFFAESDEIDPLNMSYEQFIKGLTEANERGTRDEFEAKLGAAMLTVIEQMQAQQEAAMAAAAAESGMQ